MKPYYLSAEALEKLKQELNNLKTVRRPDVVDRIHKAIQLGDLSENAEYSDAKEEQGFIEGRILELENMIRNAVIINEENNSQSVKIGSTVIIKSAEGKTKEYSIVGSNEAAPALGKISNESPIGQALLGTKKGEEVEISTPRGTIKYKITEIK
jgi:transcription elongation factor GreA